MLDNPFARRGILALWDIGSWGLATAVVIGVRHDFNLSEVLWESVIVYWLLAAALLLGLGYATKFDRGRYLVGSLDEAFGLALHLAAVGAITLGLSAVMSSPAPRSVVVLAPPLALLISAAGRLFYRALRDRLHIDESRPAGRRVLIYGAGDAGRRCSTCSAVTPTRSWASSTTTPASATCASAACPSSALARSSPRSAGRVTSTWSCSLSRPQAGSSSTGPRRPRSRPAWTSSCCRACRR